MANQENFFKKSMVYFGSSIFVQILNVFLIPIYTRNFTTAQFGEFTIVTSFQSLLAAFVTLGIFSGLSRFFYESEDQNRLKNIALTFSILWGSANVLLILLACNSVSVTVFGNNPNGPIYIKLTAINSVLVCLISIYTTYLTMEYKAFKSSLITITNLFISVITTFYLVAILKRGILGALQAQIIASVMVLGFLFSKDFKKFRFVLDRLVLKKMLTYGIGLLPGQVGMWPGAYRSLYYERPD